MTPPSPAQPPGNPPEQSPPTAGWPPPAQPPGAPPAEPPPPAGWPPPDATAAPGGRPATSLLVVGSAIFLLVAGGLVSLVGAMFGVLGGLVAGVATEAPGWVGAAAGGAVVFGLLVTGWGILQLVAGAAMLAHRPWGRRLGLGVGVVGLAFTGLSLANGLAAGVADSSLGLSLVLVAGYGFTVLALATQREHFGRT